jgi:two-component system cell cycle sensor histidine kinase/response regulator CckA
MASFEEVIMSIPIQVLILEDQLDDAELMLYELQQAGFEPGWQCVESEADYVAALQRATRPHENLDLILADYALPQFDAMCALRLLQECGLDVPFIVVTGTISEEVAVECMKQGAADYLLKDRLARLGPAVAHALQEKKLRQEKRRADAALRESEQRYRGLFDGVPVGLNRTTPAGQILDANPALVQMLGYPDRETLLAVNAVETYANPADRKRWRARIERQGIVRNFQVRMRRYDGTIIWARSNARVVRDASGQVLYYEGSLEDITERKRMKESLERSEATLKSIFRAAPVGIGLVTQQVLGWTNDALQKMIGYSGEELLDRSARMLYESDAEFERVGREKCREIEEQGMGVIETRFKRKDDRVIDVLLSSAPIDPTDLSVGMTFTALDITARKQAEKERERLLAQIREQARQVQQIVDTVPEGVILLDADLRIRLANPMAREALNGLAGADVGDTLTHLGMHTLDELLAHHTDPLPVEINLPAPSHCIFEAQARPIGQGESRQWVLTLRDVTQEREIQHHVQTQEHLATVGQLAAGIAHDFNNIMSSIVLYAGMLLRSSSLSPVERDRINVIRQQGHRAADLVQQILDFARRAVLERKPLDLVPLVQELEQLLVRTLPENIHLRLDYGQQEYVVNADPTRIQQVIMNLALNARDAMPVGGDLRFELSRFRLRPGEPAPLHDMSPGDWVCLTVADAGSGIPSDVLPHIFEPFFTTKGVGQGTGLGLAQVYGIVRQHEGHIAVESQLGSGTTFKIYLPALALPEVKTEAPPRITSPAGRGETILVVEDDATTRAAISEILTDLGYQVLTAANGREALAMFNHKIALVLSDLVMPEMGGGTLYAALEEKYPHVKMMVMTGYPVTNGGRELLKQGIMGWIAKPFSTDEIAQAVRQALG